LRGGGSPAQVLSSLVTARWPADASRLSTLRADAAAALARAATAGIGRVTWSDPAYPIALTTIADPPAVIWTRGRVAALHATALAIVGSRGASPDGFSGGRQPARDLARAGRG